VVVARAGGVLRRPRIRRALDAVMGAALVAIGVRVAAERR
jgi:threonine/homoserine/homoserine lactone efflux protein